ncbi:MAG: hypothetical protein ACXAD7_22290 [Candidatus Kariarchaeaceae archaeon]
MAPEVRSVVRKIDDYLAEGDIEKSYDEGITAVIECDESREYEKSILILNKLIECASNNNDEIIMETLQSHLILRKSVDGSLDSPSEIELKDEYIIPLAEMVKSLLESRKLGEELKYVLEGIEKQTIFGEYERLRSTPFLNFSDEDQAIRILEDYYPDGRYIINLTDAKTSLHHSLNIDVGSPKEVNVVENRRIFRIK